MRVAVRSAKIERNVAFAERKTTITNRSTLSSSFTFFHNLATRGLLFWGIADACLENDRSEIATNVSEINFFESRT